MQQAGPYIESEQRINLAGNDWAVRELEDVLSRRLPALHRYAFRLLGNTADAEDAVQDALLSAYKHLDSSEATHRCRHG